jgi:hypothetical protein
MGRELKRVAMGFSWPLEKVWEGYLSPYFSETCPSCKGGGYNPETQKIADDWYDFEQTGREWAHKITQREVLALVKAGRLWDFTRNPLDDEQREIVKKKVADGGNSWLPFDNGHVPTADQVNEWSKRGIGHDAINRGVCVKSRAKHLGVWGYCEICKGDGEVWPDLKVKLQHDRWRATEPPTGEGYQMWETVSEGSPISPVFKTAEELAHYMADNPSGSVYATFEQWMRMIDAKWAPSMVYTSKTGLISGVEAVSTNLK